MSSLSLDKKILEESQYSELIAKLVSKNYSPIIDPRSFDNPLSIKARFKIDDSKIRFVEISPSLEISVEHELPKPKAKAILKKIKEDIEEAILKKIVKTEDLETATLQLIQSGKPVIVPKNEKEQKLLEELEEKKIFSRVFAIECPACGQSFMLPFRSSSPTEKAFCADCEKWFPVKDNKEMYVVNEEYMKAIGGVWEKVQKLVRTSWREITKRGLPIIKP